MENLLRFVVVLKWLKKLTSPILFRSLQKTKTHPLILHLIADKSRYQFCHWKRLFTFVVIIFMLWRGIIWLGSQVQDLVLWDKGIYVSELWSKVKSSCTSILASWAKTEIFCLLAPPVTPHSFPSSESKLYFIPYSVLGRYMNPPPSLCNSASLWNQEVFKRWIDSAANSLTGYQVPSNDVHWLRHCYIPWSAVSKRIPNWDFHHCSRLRVA